MSRGPLRRHATTLVLVALAAIAGAFVLVVDRGSVSTGEAIARKRNVLPAWRDDEVTEVSLTSRGRTARLHRGPLDDAGQRPWVVEIDGVKHAAEEAVVDQYLGALRDGVADRKVTAGGESLASFGLDPPRAAIAIEMGPQRYRLLLGGPAPTPKGAVYAHVVGHGTMVITAQLAAALDVPLDGFRDKSMVPWGADEITAIALEGDGGPRRFVRPGGSDTRGAGFRFDGSTPEGKVRASAAAIQRVQEALGHLDAEAFLDDAAADRALARRVGVTLALRDGRRAVLDVGGSCPDHPDGIVAIRREPTRMSACVPKGTLDALVLPAADFVDRHLLAAPIDEVTELKITAEGRAQPLEIARMGGGWHLRAPADRPLDPEIGRGLLERMLAIEATRLDPEPAGGLAALGLDPPRATVRLVSVLPFRGIDAGTGERVETIAIGRDDGGEVPVRRLDDGVIARIPKDRVAALLPDEHAVRARALVEEQVSSLRALRVEARGRVQRLERDAAGGWKLLEPRGEGLAADLGLASDVADGLAGLTAVRCVGPTGKEHGLDPPRITIEAEVTGKRPIRLLLGAPTDDGSFARLGDDPTVFVAPRGVETSASRWLLDRSIFRVEPASITRATLAGEGGRRVVIEQQGGALRVAGGANDAASAAKAAAIRDALGDLTAEGAISIGPPEKAQGLDRPALEIAIEREGPSAPIRIRVGAGDVFEGTRIHYARREGVDATYAIAQSKIRPLIEAASASPR
jgi:hypothetical protein